MKTLSGLTFPWVVVAMVMALATVVTTDMIECKNNNKIQPEDKRICNTETQTCELGDENSFAYCFDKLGENGDCFNDEGCLSDYKCLPFQRGSKDNTCQKPMPKEQNGGKGNGFPPFLKNLKKALEKVRTKYNGGY